MSSTADALVALKRAVIRESLRKKGVELRPEVLRRVDLDTPYEDFRSDRVQPEDLRSSVVDLRAGWRYLMRLLKPMIRRSGGPR